MNVSAVVLTKNEERTIADCLTSLLFCDEILVIDDNSTDRTVEIIKSIKHPNIRLKSRSLEGDFSAQRNYALSQLSNEWVFFVDADEIVPEELAAEVRHVISFSTPDTDGFYIQRQDTLWGKPLQYGETGNNKLLRLARKSAGKWYGKVHETWRVKGNTSDLSHTLLHFPHQSISEFLREINMYSTVRAEELYTKKVRSNIIWILTYPKAKFIKNYLLLKGYKDGTPGFIHAVVMSFHSFLVRAKLYLLWKGIKNT